MNRHKYTMDMTTANNILQNVFIAGEQAPNTTPFDKIVLRSKAQTTMVTACMWIGIVMLLLTLLSPLAFSSRDFKVEQPRSTRSLQIVSHKLYTSEFVMLIEGDKLDYRNIYALKNDGEVVFPSKIQFVNGDTEVTIPYDGEQLNLYIPDLDGNILQAILSER
ncbi:MAG: hypothetical protein K6E16_08135 [Lachnospiraceae bacterium]|nr:hypothetical protein [Lachnospiraceae bacterium]